MILSVAFSSGFYPGPESNSDARDRFLAWSHMTTLTLTNAVEGLR